MKSQNNEINEHTDTIAQYVKQRNIRADVQQTKLRVLPADLSGNNQNWTTEMGIEANY